MTNGDASSPGAAASGADASTPGAHDAGSTPAIDAASHPTGTDSGATSPGSDAAESPPSRNSSCTPLSKMTGTEVNTTHGRMDGTLVYILPVDGSSSCNGDSAHVHLQVEMNGSVYDVAVDIGKTGDTVGWYEETMALPDGPWSEGWHGGDNLGYTSLGLHSTAFTMLDPTTMASDVEQMLASTAQISIYCTGYTPGDNGCHDVHYQNGKSDDGALVLNPMDATPTVLFFKFVSDTF